MVNDLRRGNLKHDDIVIAEWIKVCVMCIVFSDLDFHEVRRGGVLLLFIFYFPTSKTFTKKNNFNHLTNILRSLFSYWNVEMFKPWILIRFWADPDPYQNKMDSKHWNLPNTNGLVKFTKPIIYFSRLWWQCGIMSWIPGVMRRECVLREKWMQRHSHKLRSVIPGKF